MHNFLGLSLENLFWGHALQQTSIDANVTRFAVIVVLHEVNSFDGADNKEGLGVTSQSNRANGAEDVGVGELFTREVDSRLLNNDATNGKHADTSVLEFGPASILQVGLDIRPEQKAVKVCLVSQDLSTSNIMAHIVTYKRMGSKPISPGMEPSSFSGRTKKGMALDISSAFKATDPARWDCRPM